MDLPIHYPSTHWTVRKQAREQYVQEQDGLCHACGNPLTGEPIQEVLDLPINLSLFPKGMFDHPVHLHHCHKTGMTIGAIHAKCNAVLWQYCGE